MFSKTIINKFHNVKKILHVTENAGKKNYALIWVGNCVFDDNYIKTEIPLISYYTDKKGKIPEFIKRRLKNVKEIKPGYYYNGKFYDTILLPEFKSIHGKKKFPKKKFLKLLPANVDVKFVNGKITGLFDDKLFPYRIEINGNVNSDKIVKFVDDLNLDKYILLIINGKKYLI